MGELFLNLLNDSEVKISEFIAYGHIKTYGLLRPARRDSNIISSETLFGFRAHGPYQSPCQITAP